MNVELSQDGRPCTVKISLSQYAGMAELSGAVGAGMTPVISYWSSDDMLWMDGKGSDGQGPCGADSAASCSDAVKFYDFSVEGIGAAAPGAPAPAQAPPVQAAPQSVSGTAVERHGQLSVKGNTVVDKNGQPV